MFPTRILIQIILDSHFPSIWPFSSPGPKAHWWAYTMVYAFHCQTSAPLKPLGQMKPNLIWNLHGLGERKFVQMVLVTWSRWSPCEYVVKTFKKIFSGTQRLMTLKLGMQHWLLEYYQVCSNDDHGLTLTYFMARSNLLPYAFEWVKGKKNGFFRNCCSLWYRSW